MSSVSHDRSASLLAPRRPTARCPLKRTLHTSLATPPVSGSMRATSSPHFWSASHPTRHIFAEFRETQRRLSVRLLRGTVTRAPEERHGQADLRGECVP